MSIAAVQARPMGATTRIVGLHGYVFQMPLGYWATGLLGYWATGLLATRRPPKERRGLVAWVFASWQAQQATLPDWGYIRRLQSTMRAFIFQ